MNTDPKHLFNGKITPEEIVTWIAGDAAMLAEHERRVRVHVEVRVGMSRNLGLSQKNVRINIKKKTG